MRRSRAEIRITGREGSSTYVGQRSLVGIGLVVEERWHGQGRAHPVGKRARSLDDRIARTGILRQCHERHDIDCPEPRMYAVVFGEIDCIGRREGEPTRGFDDVIETFAREREHAAVMVGVGMDVDAGSAGCATELRDEELVSAFRDVHDAFVHGSCLAGLGWVTRRQPRLAAMRIGLALPQYDYSISGEHPLTFPTIVTYAQRAQELGFASVWMSDHLFLDLAKYNGPDTREFAYDPVVTLAAIATAVPEVRIGTLVALEALRNVGVLANAFATIDRISNGRLDIGLGAGWYEPDYAAIGMEMPSPGVRLRRLDEAVAALQGLVGGEPFSFSGDYHSAQRDSPMIASVQQPTPPMFVGGKGDKLLDLVARRGVGWNTCWAWTPDAYRERLGVLEAACARHDRDPASVWRSLGLYALAGENEQDLERRFARLVERSPKGVLDGVSLDQWRKGRLVGTVEQVRAQAQAWRDLGVETLIVDPGVVPFHLGAIDDLEPLADALSGL